MDNEGSIRTVVQLLRAKGYGVTGEGSVTGQSGDGGIDGTIQEDKLGLDVVCIQAKRYSDSTVGRPIVQQFVGSSLAVWILSRQTKE